MRGMLYVLAVLGMILAAGCVTQQPTWLQDLSNTANYYAPEAEARLVPYFKKARVYYPPQQIALLVFKQEMKLELWAYSNGRWVYIKTYPVFAASGEAGPKLHEGDDQVPEGIYKVVGMNPHSRFHLSLDLNYPNNFDRTEAKQDRRRNLGGNIFIHGNAVSIGCIAVGDAAIEELFVLVYKVGPAQTQVIIAPNDLRHEKPVPVAEAPRWLPLLYTDIRSALANFQYS